MNDTVMLVASFAVIALAAHRVGRWCTRLGLPYITGYLGTGALAGSFALDLIPTEAAGDLRFVDEISLGVIALVAGSELFLPDLRSRMRTIGALVSSITVVGFVVLSSSIFAITSVVSFTADLDAAARLAVALLGGAVLMALSPPSTIAVIKDVGARGPFTSLSLSVTVLMDVVVVIAFAAATSVAGALLTSTGLDLSFIGVLVLDISLGIAGGYGLGRLLGWILGRGRIHEYLQGAVLLLAAFGVYELAGWLKGWSAESLPFEIYIEPLLFTMVAGFTVTNFTSQRRRLEDLLGAMAPATYVAFFTLTGLSLKLDTLWAVLPAAVVLFGVRLVALALGTKLGRRVAGAPELGGRAWMAYVTQAGIALGLAREAGVQFPELGAAFTTLIIAVVVLNEVFGPLFLKHVLIRVGETDEVDDRSVLLFGIDRNTMRLAERLQADNWQTWLADPDADHVERARTSGWSAHVIPIEAGSSLMDALPGRPDTVVAMSDDDQANLEVCRQAEAIGVVRTVARATDPVVLRALRDMDSLVVDPTGAAVALLEEAVRAPDAASLVLNLDERHSTLEVIADLPAMGRQIRELRLPQEVLVLAVRRNGSAQIPDGFTRIVSGDHLTLVGQPDALNEAAARLGGTGRHWSPSATSRHPDVMAAQ